MRIEGEKTQLSKEILKFRKVMLALVFYVLYVMSLVISLWIDRFSSYK